LYKASIVLCITSPPMVFNHHYFCQYVLCLAKEIHFINRTSLYTEWCNGCRMSADPTSSASLHPFAGRRDSNQRLQGHILSFQDSVRLQDLFTVIARLFIHLLLLVRTRVLKYRRGKIRVLGDISEYDQYRLQFFQTRIRPCAGVISISSKAFGFFSKMRPAI
jgi:hypothetical protein